MSATEYLDRYLRTYDLDDTLRTEDLLSDSSLCKENRFVPEEPLPRRERRQYTFG
jgi:hypothetical protein